MSTDERLERLENEVRRLTDAVAALVAVATSSESPALDLEARHDAFVARLESRRQEDA